MELQPGGWPSSRMKDLVDVVFYATSKAFSLRQLSHSIECECGRREMAVPEQFRAPATWKTGFPAFAKKSGLEPAYTSFEAACKLASSFFDPALRKVESTDELTWNPKELRWG